uniref:Hermansky-Pudlak syndrome 5 protein homolog n=1 Tax=Denticeps clupeoides TaxID=299321 RepID=A0AAY4DEX7_9TELE
IASAVFNTSTHVLAEFDCLDPLLSALRLDSGRLKCTCLAVSRKWLALGTSAGGLHLIQKEGWKQRLILTHKEGSITQVACCPHDEDFVAVATSQGLVVVWELQLERRGRPERTSVSWEHRGQAVTSLCWDTSGLRVFAGDTGGKVSFVRAGSTKHGKGSAFVIFPVQTITTVDSRVVQLGYQEGRLLVSSLSRCYLCDTEREKFWRVGNKERDGEYGACFLPQPRGLSGTPLLYCARPGSRVWEASFSGEVLSTHQFKQLLACPSTPLITYKYQKTPQSLAFPRLDQNLLTWTDSAIYMFTPQSGQVLLWTEIKGKDLCPYWDELFCLHGDGRLSHLSLMSAERCVERLLRRESWTLAATVCCMFQHAISSCRARKCLPIDRLEHLKLQLSSSTHQPLINQLEEMMAKLEPLDSASSSRRSSISSHESFNVLDCGIYRVISRRGSQSDEDSSSLVSQSMLEEERLKEFSFVQEEDQGEQGAQQTERTEADRSEPGLQFHLPLSFRPKPPRIALQAVRDSVSSFVKKTTEKINTLQMNTDIWQRMDQREGWQGEVVSVMPQCPEEHCELHVPFCPYLDIKPLAQIQDPLILLDPVSLAAALQEWLMVLEKVLGPEEQDHSGQEQEGEEKSVEREVETTSCLTEQDFGDVGEPMEQLEAAGKEEPKTICIRPPNETVRMLSPRPLPSDLKDDLSQIASLCFDMGCFSHAGSVDHVCVESVCSFMQRFFFLVDPERVHRVCGLRYQEHPEVLNIFITGMLGDMLKSLRSLRELQPWKAPLLLTHLYRLYEKHGELAVRSFPQFYPTVLPSDVMAMAQSSHFLPYLDNLVQSRAEEQKLSFIGSLLQPETLRQDWLELALSHDAPQRSDTLTAEGHPRWHSHFFSWGYSRLISLLIRQPADLDSKQKMLETCKGQGYWTGYLYLCNQLHRRSEAFSAICSLNDMSLLEEPNGIVPQNLDEWRLLIQLSQKICSSSTAASNGTNHNNGDTSSSFLNGSADWSGHICPESLVLRLARVVGPDRAMETLHECGVQLELGPQSTLVCELLKVAEKRQRALIQTMLERCDRFLWSQQA